MRTGSSRYPRPTLARSEPTRTASAGGQLRTLNRLGAEALADLAVGIDAGPVWSVSDRRTAGALDRVTRTASAGGQLRTLNRLGAEALADLAVGIDD